MNQLIADGHYIGLAEASNTPGLDLIVDGQPVQVKCGTALSNLTEQFEKYPDITVIANAALAEKAAQSDAPWAHLLTTVPGFEIETLEEQIAETLGHAADLASPDILQFALSIGALRGGWKSCRGGSQFRTCLPGSFSTVRPEERWPLLAARPVLGSV